MPPQNSPENPSEPSASLSSATPRVALLLSSYKYNFAFSPTLIPNMRLPPFCPPTIYLNIRLPSSTLFSDILRPSPALSTNIPLPSSIYLSDILLPSSSHFSDVLLPSVMPH